MHGGLGAACWLGLWALAAWTAAAGENAAAADGSGASTAAAAQVPAPRPRAVRPLTSRAPARALAEEALPGGIRAGALTLRPMAEVTYLWDDNVLGLPGVTERPDFQVSYLSGLAFEWQPLTALRADGSYTFGWTDYLDNEARDYLSHEAALNLVWQHAGARGLTLSWAQSYRQTGNTDVLDNEFSAFRRLDGHNLSPAVSYQTGTLGLRASYRREEVDYFSRTDRPQDYVTHGAEGLFYYRLTERSLLAYTRYEGEATRFAVLDQRDFESHMGAAGIRGRHERLSYELECGYRQGNGHALRKDDGGWVLATVLEYQAARFVSVQGSARREFVPQVTTGNSMQSSVSVEAFFRAQSRLDLKAGLDWFQDDRASGLRQRTLTARVESAYRLGRYLEWTARYERLERTSDQGPDVTINRAHLGLRVSF